MNGNILLIIIAFISLAAGGIITYLFHLMILRNRSTNIIKEAEAEAEVIRKDKILQAKEKFLQLRSEHEKVINDKNQRVLVAENTLKQREGSLSQKTEEIHRKNKEVDAIRDNLAHQLDILERKKEELDKSHKQQVEQLETISQLSADEARNQLIESLKDEAKSEAMSSISEIVDEAKLTANREAKNIVVKTIQRVATETAIENSVTVFNIDNDEIKGRIIGRE